MNPIFLPDVQKAAGGPQGDAIRELREAGLPVPPIMHLTSFKPAWTEHLMRFVQSVMRGTSPLSPGQRELIAAFVSRRNQCVY